jgi:hypothetical protein
LIIPLLLHSSLPHSSNATYTYKGLGIVSFHKNGILIGFRMLCFTFCKVKTIITKALVCNPTLDISINLLISGKISPDIGEQCSRLKTSYEFFCEGQFLVLHMTFSFHYSTSHSPFYKHFTKSSQYCNSSIVI